MNPTRLYLARHGATSRTAEDRFSGAVGVPLSDEGRHQAGRLAERLRAVGLQAIYASPLDRALETARIVGRAAGIDPVEREGLREIAHGHWEGLRRDEVEARFSEEYAAWEADPFSFAPEGGESGVAVLARALPVVREIVTRHAGQRVLVVSHKATIRLVLSSLLDSTRAVTAIGSIRPRRASTCWISRDPVHARLMLFNDTSHYSDEPRLLDRHLSKWWDTPSSS